MSLKLHLLRHGETVSSRDELFCGSGTDAKLTDNGAKMAASFAHSYREFKWDAIYASPLRRAQDTASPAVANTGLKLETRAGLAEIAYGAWEGKTKPEVLKLYHDEFIRWEEDPEFNAPTGGGETAAQLAARAISVVDEIRSRHQTGEVLAVSHKATIRVILCSLLQVELSKFRRRFDCPVCSVATVQFNRTGPMLLSLADRSHLPLQLRSLKGT